MNISAPNAVNTLYIGGGTPSVLPLDVLARIVKAIALQEALRQAQRPMVGTSDKSSVSSVTELFSPVTEPVVRHGSPTFEATVPTAPFEEFTVEVNPEDIVEKGSEYVRGLLALGVNRISMGVQSFDDGILRWMNRRHDGTRAIKAFQILRECGVQNISIDLIFGISQLTDEIWKDTIEEALALAPEHISAYQLSIEEGSALAKMVSDGRYVEASDEQCRRQYDLLCRTLKQSGYHHYEISNFAKPGFEAVHNSAYWRRVPYIGLGPGAHSLIGDVRSWNSQVLPHLTLDCNPITGGSLKSSGNPDNLATYSRSFETLSPEDIRVEKIMLSLRTDKGMEATELYSLAERSVVDSLLIEGALEHSSSRIRIPESHLFVSDEIIRELI